MSFFLINYKIQTKRKMISLFKYIEKYGNFNFYEKKFTEVDNVILSALAYIDFNGIVSNNVKEKKTLKDVAASFFTKYTKEDISNNILSIKEAIKVLEKIKDYKRYQDLLLYNYIYEKNEEKQFCAICIKVTKDLVYVSYEGTDELISGWKEDFELSYKFPVPSHIDAVNYLNSSIKWNDKRIIIGGHSKGGNLALIAAMYCNFFIRRKIINVYSNDGPGILEEELKSKNLKRISKKYIHIIPSYSIVGLILNHPNNDKVIKSSKKGILAHDLLTWEVEDDKFIEDRLSNSSIRFKEITDKWLKEYSKKEKEELTKELFSIFERENITTLLDIKKQKMIGIINLIKQSKNMDDKSKNMFKDLLMIVIDEYSDNPKKIIKETVEEGKKILKIK